MARNEGDLEIYTGIKSEHAIKMSRAAIKMSNNKTTGENAMVNEMIKYSS